MVRPLLRLHRQPTHLHQTKKRREVVVPGTLPLLGPRGFKCVRTPTSFARARSVLVLYWLAYILDITK
ncbi:hypothetical protein JG687_00015967 [Phytophthora cactorum]|uniref:Uncharacterized protein n=1 Tax=Phytophthora cactorum TaxID=29920 RepID=A0A8T1TUX4_9STRA|nr:hypothetical protein JG687_00015967 [Phytophthora cactorum]